ncbi:hypothetical protein KP509_03G066900 [Ceratopteris richardii]|uniref:Proline-rich protein PRCC n=1 Tax=Ceratopteris richardii TaxID=49495 RepID=A0A8T2V0S0_CERRI|nr:hypothetical protein KP509_03G066900 [Ceratopteris richardii]
MESLIANYASDDEEDEPQEQSTRRYLASSLPPLKVKDDVVSSVPIRGSLFSSLPRPKFATENVQASVPSGLEETKGRDLKNMIRNKVTSGENRYEETRSSLFASLPRPKFASKDIQISKAVNFTPEVTSKVPLEGIQREQAEENLYALSSGLSSTVNEGSSYSHRASDPLNGPPLTKGSPFSALPPPKNSGSVVAPNVSQRSSAAIPKRVVEIRPAIDMALLQETDDEDRNASPPTKRHAAGGRAAGLTAILPKPKNLGSALGSGFVSGHQTTLDIGTLNSVSQPMIGSSAASDQNAAIGVGDSVMSTMANQIKLAPYESTSVSDQHPYEGVVDSHVCQEGVQRDPDISSSYFHSSFHVEGSSDMESSLIPPEAYSQEMSAQETYGNTEPSAEDALAEMLARERRRGSKKAPINVIEVKQEDLTAKKLREDQLKATGIAFGPAYKPVSSGGKPSKLHRRKHQIGSLYYDMKQKEMELMERRAKGYMTKAETQAKYGW